MKNIRRLNNDITDGHRVKIQLSKKTEHKNYILEKKFDRCLEFIYTYVFSHFNYRTICNQINRCFIEVCTKIDLFPLTTLQQMKSRSNYITNFRNISAKINANGKTPFQFSSNSELLLIKLPLQKHFPKYAVCRKKI